MLVACTAWYSNLKVKNKLQVIQNKCIRFYLKLQCREHEHAKWTLSETELATNKSKVQTICQHYSIQICSKQIPILLEVSRAAENIRITARNSYLKLGDPFQKTSTRQNSLSYSGPAIWNRISEILKKTKNFNTFFYSLVI